MLFISLFPIFAANFGKLIINLQKYCFFCIYANNKRFFYQMRGFFLKSLTFYGFLSHFVRTIITRRVHTIPSLCFHLSVFRFHLSVFRFTKERLNVSIDTSKKNDNIKTHPLLSARDELELKICNFLNFFHDC